MFQAGMSQADPRVIFSISAKEDFGWPDGFKDASDDELEAPRLECQWALWSLDGECSRRREGKAESTTSSACEETIKKNAASGVKAEKE